MKNTMKYLGIAVLLLAGMCFAQDSSNFQPSSTNVWGADYPKVDSTGRVEIRIKAPDATKVKLNFWSGPKIDMVKQPDGFWTVTTSPLVPGFHYYTLNIDGAEVADPLLWIACVLAGGGNRGDGYALGLGASARCCRCPSERSRRGGFADDRIGDRRPAGSGRVNSAGRRLGSDADVAERDGRDPRSSCCRRRRCVELAAAVDRDVASTGRSGWPYAGAGT